MAAPLAARPPESVVYAMVSRGPTVLAEFSRASGNFEQVARLLLGKLTQGKAPADVEAGVKRLSFEHGREGEYLFHVLQTPVGLWFLALADKALPSRVAFAFLDDLHNKFTARYAESEWKEAITFGLSDFGPVLASEMQRFQVNDPKVSRVREQLEEVKDVMVSNIDALLERGERIELLVDQTDRLSQAAFRFEQSSVKLRQQLWWKRARNQLFMAAGCLFIVFISISVGCGGLDFSRCGR